MKTELTFEETRVIGALIEKEKTTPDQYPLSLNGLTNACNQKSNREPVVDYSETQVQSVLDSLRKKGMVMEDSGFGSRVAKYKHRFANTEFGELKLNDQELGIITVLFLRGPQTPGELRGRTNRLCQFSDVSDVEVVLNGLISREDGPFVAKLEREPGKRENRYIHLFSGEPDLSITVSHTEQATELDEGLASRVADLEQRVAKLESMLASLVDS